LSHATGGSTAKLGKLFESKEALLAITALLGPQAQTYTDKLKEMGKASGATEAALNEQENGVNKTGAAFERMKQRLIVFAQRMGDKLLPFFDKVLDRLTPFLDKLGSLSEADISKWFKVAGAIAAIGPILSVGGPVISGISSLVGMISGAGGVSGALTALGTAATGPIGISILALTAAGVAAIYFKDQLTPIRDVVKELGGGLLQTMNKEWSKLGSGTSTMSTDLKGIVGIWAQAEAGLLKFVGSIALEPLKMLITQLRRLFSVGRSLYSIFQSLKTIMGYVGGKIGEQLGKMGDIIMEKIVNKLPFIDKIKVVFSGLGGILGWVADKIKLLANGVASIPELPGALLEFIGGKLEGVATGMGGGRQNEAPRKSMRQSVDVNIKVDAADGAKVGVNSKGGNPKVQNKRGGIMTPGLAI